MQFPNTRSSRVRLRRSDVIDHDSRNRFMKRCLVFSVFAALIVAAEVGAQDQEATLRQDGLAFLKEQFAGKVVPQPMRAELKEAIRAHLAEGGRAPLGGQLFRNDRGLALGLIMEPSPDEKREHARAWAGLDKLKAGRATDAKFMVAYADTMLEQVKDGHESPPASSRFAESNQRACEIQIKSVSSAAKMLELMSRAPGANVASLAGIYEAGVLGAKHPAYAILPSRRLTFRTDRCGLLLVKFGVFDPSEQELEDLRKATAGVPLVILEVVGMHGRVRVDDEGLVELCQGTLKDLFPADQ
jgi:hypothetical protein